MTHLKAIFFILIAVIVIILVVQNDEAMSTNVQFRIKPVFFGEQRTGDISLYQIVTVTFLLGVISTGIYGMVERFRLKKTIRKLKKEMTDKDKELGSLRNLPVTYKEAVSSRTESAGGI